MKTVPDQHVLKSRLRKGLRARRNGIAETQRDKLDAAINRHLVEYAHAARLSDIAAYFAFDGEPDLFPALQALEADGVTIALPIIKNVAGRDTMVFGRWTRNCRMVPNRYGILEPAGTEEIPIPQFDLALLPLVGWDRRGIRLGMGASYYDRAFQPFAQSPRPMRMGVAYEAQEQAGLPRDPWDISLHAMLTEKGWFTCER